MKPDDVRAEIAKFAANEYQILLSTTIVEVGVNVPNATVIVIKNAERFGLAQLHQLRGRVGRSRLQSYCVLLSNQKDNPRLLTMVQTTDGFEVARQDLLQRGMGNLVGVEQSGYHEAVKLMIAEPDMYREICAVLEGDPALTESLVLAEAQRKERERRIQERRKEEKEKEQEGTGAASKKAKPSGRRKAGPLGLTGDWEESVVQEAESFFELTRFFPDVPDMIQKRVMRHAV